MAKENDNVKEIMIICITGERNPKTVYGALIKQLLLEKQPTKCIFGECVGIDQAAKLICQELEIPYQIYYADWKQYGRAAGPVRNQQMIDSRPDLVMAFHPCLVKARGTKDTVNRAKKANIPVEIWD